MADGKELCRFCVVSKKGHYCALHDKWLAADPNFVHKTAECIEAAAVGNMNVGEETTAQVNPKVIIRETIKEYNKMVKHLLQEGYPRPLAETIAQKHMIGD